MDTDVNAAVRAEAAWGAARSAPVAVYLTVGTGIGGGIAIHGEVVEGLLHPEMGHVTVPRLAGDGFEGSCRFHGACLEGMASGVAVAARWGIKGEDLPGDHPAWVLEARYLAAGIAQVVLVLSPNVVVAGGGVMRQRGLRAAVNTRLMEAMGGYAAAPPVVPPHFDDRAGLMGALALAGVAASR
jgi:fructokinase